MRANLTSVFCALLAVPVVFGQQPVPSEAAPEVARLLQPDPAEQTLACEVHPDRPALSYRLVYRSRYSVRLPLGQFANQPNTLSVLLRVTPKLDGAEPLLLSQTWNLPAAPDGHERDAAKSEAEVQGGFFVGVGRYHAELVLTDSQHRVCRGRWNLEVKEHNSKATALAPGQAAAASQFDWPRLETRSGKATIFLHAGPPRGNRVLLASLAAMLERMPFSRFQVAVFSLDQHRELLRQNVADPGAFRRIAEALNDYNPSTVSYRVLQDPKGHREFLWQLLAKETLRAEPPDAVLFLGYSTFDDTHVFAPPACADGSQKTLYAYFDYAEPDIRRLPGTRRLTVRGPGRGGLRDEPDTEYSWTGKAGPELPDAIARITRACSGKVFPIYSPDDLASALEKTTELLRER